MRQRNKTTALTGRRCMQKRVMQTSGENARSIPVFSDVFIPSCHTSGSVLGCCNIQDDSKQTNKHAVSQVSTPLKQRKTCLPYLKAGKQKLLTFLPPLRIYFCFFFTCNAPFVSPSLAIQLAISDDPHYRVLCPFRQHGQLPSTFVDLLRSIVSQVSFVYTNAIKTTQMKTKPTQ